MRDHDTDSVPALRDRLSADHRKIEDLLDQVVNAFETGDRRFVGEVWTRFKAELLAHLEAEERHLIPALSQIDAREARAISEEHRHLRTRLQELGVGIDLHVVNLPSARAFTDELRAHAAHEDQALYAWADHYLDEEKRASLLREFADLVKARLLARAGVLL